MRTFARILLLSDEMVPKYYQNWKEDAFDGIDLIISVGDLPARYLEFIATMFTGDVLYVPGNHDNRYVEHPPLGCIDIDDRIFIWHGLRILGLGGSMRYKEGPFQYTQAEMKKRVHKLWWQLFKNKGFDILVTHSPAFGIHDGKDLCHTGFTAFTWLIHKYHPSYFFHGHVHMSYGDYPRHYTIEDTVVVNGFESWVVEVPLPHPEEEKIL